MAWLVGACGVLSACAGSDDGTRGGEPEDVAYVETGDIERLRARGRLRLGNAVRAHLDDVPALSWGSPSGDAVARTFAARLGLELEVVDYADPASARAALLEGWIDGMVSRRIEGSTAPPPDGVARSRPFRREPGVFLARDGAAPDSLPELEGRTVTFGTGDGLIGLGDEIVAAAPTVTVDTLQGLTVEDALDRLIRGEIDLTLVERWVAEALVVARPELEMGMEFGSVTYAAAVRATNPDLLRLVNDFAFEALPVGVDAPPLFGDMDAILERRVLRVLTVNGPSSYYVYRGDVVGFDLDL
ncbi:MAG: transporter substrate-binding domain-containing protein, partial [Gemmatimonadota bacterium]